MHRWRRARNSAGLMGHTGLMGTACGAQKRESVRTSGRHGRCHASSASTLANRVCRLSSRLERRTAADTDHTWAQRQRPAGGDLLPLPGRRSRSGCVEGSGLGPLLSFFFSSTAPSFSPAMSSQSGNPISPPPAPSAAANAGGVRRHHTISSSSRANRPTSKIALSEIDIDDPQAEQLWNDDEVVDQDWVGGIGAVGEKSSLHRQASLPTRYHRGKYAPINLLALCPPRGRIMSGRPRLIVALRSVRRPTCQAARSPHSSHSQLSLRHRWARRRGGRMGA